VFVLSPEGTLRPVTKPWRILLAKK
jgi:hypothetical protein